MHEEMQEYKIILTWEAIYDVTDIADDSEEEFGQQHACLLYTSFFYVIRAYFHAADPAIQISHLHV